MEDTRVPDKWSELRLELSEEYLQSLKDRVRVRNTQMNNNSILINKGDVNKEHHKNNGKYNDCTKNRRCTIL